MESSLASGLVHLLLLSVFSTLSIFQDSQQTTQLTLGYRALTSSSGLSLHVYSPNDGQDVYEDSFMKIAKPDGQTFHPTLILIRTRLGIDKITPIYWNALIAALHMPQSVGIAGYVVF